MHIYIFKNWHILTSCNFSINKINNINIAINIYKYMALTIINTWIFYSIDDNMISYNKGQLKRSDERN